MAGTGWIDVSGTTRRELLG